PPNDRPCSLISRVSASTFAAWSNALDGIHPMLRHTPPSVGPRSTSTTCLPRSAARNAAVYPPGPAPSTNTCAFRSAGADGGDTPVSTVLTGPTAGRPRGGGTDG